MPKFKYADTIGHLLFIGAGLAFTVKMLIAIIAK